MGLWDHPVYTCTYTLYVSYAQLYMELGLPSSSAFSTAPDTPLFLPGNCVQMGVPFASSQWPPTTTKPSTKP